MKKYICVEVKHHKDIAKTIDEYQTKVITSTPIKQQAYRITR